MKKHGILNSSIAKVLADLGHTDQITVADCGLPVPEGVAKIDLALRLGQPSFIQVVDVLIQEMQIEKIILAEEIQTDNPQVLAELKGLLGQEIPIEFLPHEAFKGRTQSSKAVIRTGEATPYANVVLQSGVIF